MIVLTIAKSLALNSTSDTQILIISISGLTTLTFGVLRDGNTRSVAAKFGADTYNDTERN